MQVLSGARQWLLGSFLGGMAAVLTAGLANPASAQPAHSEAAVKAAYLFRFADYVEWPEQSVAGHAFVIDVEGAPGVAHELRRLVAGHVINSREVQVREVGSVRELGNAQMLYVGPGHTDFLRALSSSAVTPTLVVSDEESGLDLGGMLNFVTIDNRVRFEVSLAAAERAKLKISADLLSVAIRVHGGRRQSDERCIPFPLPQAGDAPCDLRHAERIQERMHGFTRRYDNERSAIGRS
jgi:hypothetical protein